MKLSPAHAEIHYMGCEEYTYMVSRIHADICARRTSPAKLADRSQSSLFVDFYPHAQSVAVFRPFLQLYVPQRLTNGYIDGKTIQIYPESDALHLPQYIPVSIRQDYEEACSIKARSPKASATLARRCLQGMIRDFWGIKRDRLIDEIADLQGKIPASQWAAIDALRKIGNIGAHMEKDVNTIIHVDPGEAERLIMLIELLIDKWYIARHEETVLLERIVADADSKRR